MDTPRGMEGKKYATWDSPVEKAMIQNVVEEDGGDYSKVEMIPSTVTDEVSALQSKSVDAIWIFYGWAGVKMELEYVMTDKETGELRTTAKSSHCFLNRSGKPISLKRAYPALDTKFFEMKEDME